MCSHAGWLYHVVRVSIGNSWSKAKLGRNVMNQGATFRSLSTAEISFSSVSTLETGPGVFRRKNSARLSGETVWREVFPRPIGNFPRTEQASRSTRWRICLERSPVHDSSRWCFIGLQRLRAACWASDERRFHVFNLLPRGQNDRAV